MQLSTAQTVLGSQRLQTPECGCSGSFSYSCIEQDSCSGAAKGCLKCELCHNQYSSFPQEDAQWCSFCSVTQMNRYCIEEGATCSRVSDPWERLRSCLCWNTGYDSGLTWVGKEWACYFKHWPGDSQAVVTLHIHIPSQLLLQSKTCNFTLHPFVLKATFYSVSMIYIF